MSILILINDAPYGTEKAYNGLRLAMAIQKDHTAVQVNVFLMADAVACALPNQSTAQGYYNTERMLKSVLSKGGKVKACGTCADARGVRNLPLIEGIEMSNMAELAQWSVDADKVFTF
ncbi:MAG: DsrE family protein [Bacteroidetes bacterium]|nr:DsrE family protein [Bacteroidota bacterium]MCW5896072.1 DsrE family protein [Bacteroidota bacterium]